MIDAVLIGLDEPAMHEANMQVLESALQRIQHSKYFAITTNIWLTTPTFIQRLILIIHSIELYDEYDI